MKVFGDVCVRMRWNLLLKLKVQKFLSRESDLAARLVLYVFLCDNIDLDAFCDAGVAFALAMSGELLAASKVSAQQAVRMDVARTDHR